MTVKTATTAKAAKPAKPKLRTSGKKKQPASMITSADIEESMKAFLKQGGKIEKIEAGVSGQYNTGKPMAVGASKIAR